MSIIDDLNKITDKEQLALRLLYESETWFRALGLSRNPEIKDLCDKIEEFREGKTGKENND